MSENEGCNHYKRFCRFLTPCCSKIYTCRFCHDDNENHSLNRSDVSHILCIKCNKLQTVKHCCDNCGVRFGNYTCLICNLFDNEDKKQFHCDECGLCRIGGEENYFHCKKCNVCYSLRLIDNHACLENNSRGHCPICIEDLHSSRLLVFVPRCGHLLHTACYEELKKKANAICPLCNAHY